MDWQIASPNPMPLDFVVKNASKTRSMSLGSIPVPVSSMDTATAFDYTKPLGSRPPEVPEPIRRQFAVPHRVLNVAGNTQNSAFSRFGSLM